MGTTDIEKLKKELVSYVNDHKSDYYEIFKLYDDRKCKSHHKDFCDFFCSKIKKCSDFNEKKISTSIKYYKDLFYKIGKCQKLTKHHKVCTATVSVCLASICKCCKKDCHKNNTCIIENSFESSCDRTCSTDASFSFKEGSICKLSSGKSCESSSECKKSSTSCNEIPYKSKHSKRYNKKCDSPCDNESSRSDGYSYKCNDRENNCNPCKDVCDTDESYPFADACLKGGCAQTTRDDSCGFGEGDDLEQLRKTTGRLKVVTKQLCMLISILCEMQKAFVEKMNCFGVCDAECKINCIDIDYQNKLMYILYRQIDSLVTQNNCVFNGTKDTQAIKVYLSCGKSLPVVLIDNVKFTLVKDCGKNYILVNVGSRQYQLWFLGDCMTNSAAICILKQNLCTVKLILQALVSNKKMILHWFSVSDRMAQCKEICDTNDKKDCSCNDKPKCAAW